VESESEVEWWTHREHGHHAVTGSVACGVGAVNGVRGQIPLGRRLVLPTQLNRYYFKFPNSTQTCKLKREDFPCFKNIKFCMRLDLKILINFVNWVNFKFSSEFME
jgi:hypothetical protein